MQKPRRRRRSTPQPIVDYIHALAHRKTTGEIASAIAKEPAFAELTHPSDRTIYSIAQEVPRRPEPHEAWRLETSDPDDARHVLDALAVRIRSLGDQAQLTEAEAVWVARLGRAIDDMDAEIALLFAMRYVGRAAAGESAADIDRTIAEGRWRDPMEGEVHAAGSRYESPADWGVPLDDPGHGSVERLTRQLRKKGDQK